MELMRALGVLAEPPAPEHARVARLLGLPEFPEAALHESVFLFQAYPLASVYLNGNGMMGGTARDRVAGFWRAIEIQPPDDPDHIAALFGLYAELREREHDEADAPRRDAYRHAAGALLHEHVASWLGSFVHAVAQAGSPFHAEWASLVARVVTDELQRHTIEGLPLHLSDAPPMADPRSDGGAAFLEALLAPVRSGMVLTRSTLARLAGDLGLGLRAGERRFVVESFMAQDPAATLTWLADEAGRWTAVHDRAPAPDVVRAFWRNRAERAAVLLLELAEAAEAANA